MQTLSSTPRKIKIPMTPSPSFEFKGINGIAGYVWLIMIFRLILETIRRRPYYTINNKVTV